MFFQSQAGVYALPLALGRLAVAQEYFGRPLLPDPAASNCFPGGSDWDKGPESLERLRGFEGGREVYRRSINKLGDYLGRNLFRDGKVLEIGCSLGRKKIVALEYAGSWMAVDYDPTVIREAQKKHAGCFYATASVFQLPFAKESFDVVYSHAFLDILTDLPGALAEISRILKRGGFLLHLIDCSPNSNVTGEELARRGLATFRRTTDTVPQFLSLKGSDNVRVYSPSPIKFHTSDSLSDESARAMDEYLWSQDRIIAKTPEVSHSLLSTALICRGLKGTGFFSEPEAGFFLSFYPQKRSDAPPFKVSHLPRFERIFSTDVSPWALPRFLAYFHLWGHTLLQHLRFCGGLEVYAADYLLAQKIT